VVVATRGRFITLEGIDGAGKSTHLSWIADELRAKGHEVVGTREPGGTPLGEELRRLVLHHPMHPETEALLVFAARREHIAQVISPALERGVWVLSDRFTDASFAYQGGGRGVAEDKLAVLEHWVQDGLQPDLTIVFDIDPAAAQARFLAAHSEPDRFEREQSGFFASVRAMYLRRAQQFPDRIRVIDASVSLAEIRQNLSPIIQLA